ncbi:MAG TPA: hypothetical protein VIH06_04410, partial [Ilumatobacteraceae bacterium]
MRRRRGLPIIIIMVGLALFLGLAAASRALYNQTEDRLLHQRATEAGQAIELTVSQLQAPLDAAAALAFATDGDPATFEQIIDRYIGTAPKLFTSAALYRVGSDTPVASVGKPLALATEPDNATSAMLDDATKKPFVIVDLLG